MTLADGIRKVIDAGIDVVEIEDPALISILELVKQVVNTPGGIEWLGNELRGFVQLRQK